MLRHRLVLASLVAVAFGTTVASASTATSAPMVASDQQRRFGQSKLDALPRYCRGCEVLFACHGECPRNRFVSTPDGDPGLNYLCAGYKPFFEHIDEPMKIMANLLGQGRPAAEVMEWHAGREEARSTGVGRNDPCPCGSGAKFKRCHGRDPRPPAPAG